MLRKSWWAWVRRCLRQKGLRRLALGTFAAFEMALLLALVARPAYGYVDPGAGLLAVQVCGSMLAGALLVLRSRVRKLLGLGPRATQNVEAQDGGSTAP